MMRLEVEKKERKSISSFAFRVLSPHKKHKTNSKNSLMQNSRGLIATTTTT
jgi:hypothetical protein